MDAELRRAIQKVKHSGQVVELITTLLKESLLDWPQAHSIELAAHDAYTRKTLTVYLWAQSPNAHREGLLHRWRLPRGQEVYRSLCGLATTARLEWLRENAELFVAQNNTTCRQCEHRGHLMTLRVVG